MNNRYEQERERVLKELRKRLDELFPSVEKLPEPDPICYKCKVPMLQVFEKGQHYFWCAERGCGHREFSI